MKILVGIPKQRRKRIQSGRVNAAASIALALGIVYVCASPAMDVIDNADILSMTEQAQNHESLAVLGPAVVKDPLSYTEVPYIVQNAETKANDDDIAAFIEAMHIPLDGVITSVPGEREDPFAVGSGALEYHRGTDIAVTDDYAVRAAEGGIAVKADTDPSYGNYIVIDHGGGIKTLYAHLEYIYLNEGDSVYRGMLIGKAGMTGRATGVHLHFEIIS